MRAAKRAAHSELSVSKGEWQRNGYARSELLSTAGIVDQVERVHWSVRRPRSQRDLHAAGPWTSGLQRSTEVVSSCNAWSCSAAI